MVRRVAGWLLVAVLVSHAFANSQTYHEPEGRPLAVVSELSQRLASHSHLQELGDSRLGLSSRLESGDSRPGLISLLEPGDSRPGLISRLEPGDSRLGLTSRQEPGDSRLGLTSRLEPGDSKLGLPSPQEIDAIKKVAQILVMLGEQVIPTIIGNVIPPPTHVVSSSEAVVPVEDAPNDPVNEN